MEIIRWMLVQGKIVSIPVTFPNLSRIEAVRITDPDKEVAPGYYGIPEPLPALVEKRNFSPRDIELVVAPGSVFDRFGGRLGYGGGYYDRFFTTGAAGAVRMGLAFEIQMVEKVPLEPHDQLMDFVVTEDNLYDCRRNIYA